MRGLPRTRAHAPKVVLPSDWEWADRIDAFALRRMAEVTRVLFAQPERWIHRRVERIYFKDDLSAHHQISVDFTLPSGMPAVGEFDGKPVYIAPLFLLVKDPPEPMREGEPPARRLLFFGGREPDLHKRRIPTAPYSNLGFVGQDGENLTLLTRRQSSLLATMVLLETAEKVLARPVEGRLRDELSAIPQRSFFALEGVMNWLLEESAPNGDARLSLRDDKAFVELAYTLASHSIIVCLFTDGAPQRSLLKLSYDEPANTGRASRPGLARSALRWASAEYYVALNEIGAASSYHLEVEVPSELEIDAISLVGKSYERYGDPLSTEGRDYTIQQAGPPSEGRVYIWEPLPGRRVGLARVKLHARRWSGFLFAAWLASGVTTIMLGLAAYAAPHVRNGKTAIATAVLLLVPAIMSAYVAQQGEHGMTTKLLRWARFALFADALLPLLAVFFLIVGQTEAEPEKVAASLTFGPFAFTFGAARQAAGYSGLRAAWIPLAAVSFAISVTFLLSNALRFRDATVYEPMPESLR